MSYTRCWHRWHDTRGDGCWEFAQTNAGTRGTALHWGNYTMMSTVIIEKMLLERRFQQVFVAQRLKPQFQFCAV